MNQDENNSQLADFQVAMLEHLASHSTLSELMVAIESDPRLEPWQEYIAQFDSHMLLLAAELTKKWGVRRAK